LNQLLICVQLTMVARFNIAARYVGFIENQRFDVRLRSQALGSRDVMHTDLSMYQNIVSSFCA
jgi:hypothetical protein